MISSVCQGLQSYVEPRVFSLELFPYESSFSSRSTMNAHEEDEVEGNSKISIARNGDHSVRRSLGNTRNGEGWCFLQALSNGSGIHDNGKEDKVYVYPLVKRSSSKLSKKSLEMCTESLGSESGSDIGENDISVVNLERDNSRCSERASNWVAKKANRRDSNFPPPLTSISGSTGVRVESHREDGRLVLRAVAISASRSSYFHADRSQGRLKLQLVKNIEKRVNEEDEADDEVGEEDEGYGGEEEAYGGNEEREENEGKDGEKMGMEEFGRPCRCSKEGRRESKELLNLEPFLIFT